MPQPRIGLWQCITPPPRCGQSVFPTARGLRSQQHPLDVKFGFEARPTRGRKKETRSCECEMEKGLVPGTVNGRHVSRGHLKLREDGGLVIAKGVKFNVQETNKGLLDLLPPTTAEGVEFQEEDAKPQSKKELAEEIEFTSRYLLSEENYSLEEVIKLYNKLEELGDTDLRIGKKTAVTSWYTGAFVHGGCAGLRKNIMKYPHTTKYLVQVGKKYANGMKFTALGLARNATLGMHRDVHNYKNSENMVLPLTSFTGGSLWTLGPDVDEENAVYKTLPNGDKAKGKMIELTTRAKQ